MTPAPNNDETAEMLRDDDALAVLEGLSRTHHATTLYGEDHPAAGEAAAETADALQRALAARASLFFGVAGDRFLLGPSELPGSEELGSLLGLFVRLEIGALEVRPGLGPEDFLALVGLLLQAKQQRERASELADEIEARFGERVRLVPVDYSSLRAAEGVEGGQTKAISWADMARSLMTSLGGGDEAAEPDVLARRINASVDPLDKPGVDELRRRLRRMAGTAADAPRDGDAPAIGQLRAFVHTLKPELREAMMRVDVERPSEWMGFAAELAHVWPTEDVLRALDNVERVAGTASEEALLLLSRLATIAIDDPDQTDELAGTARAWASKTGSSDPGGELLRSLSEVLGSRERHSSTPQDYRKQLQEIAGRVRHRTSALDVTDLSDRGRLEVHTAAVAVEMLDDSSVMERHGSRLFEHLAGCLRRLLEVGRFDLVWSAVESATKVPAGASEATAATLLREELAATAPRLSESLRRLDTVTPEAAALLRHLGEAALAPILSVLVEDLASSVRAKLVEIAAAADPIVLAREVGELVAREPDAARSLVHLIEPLPHETALQIVGPVLQVGQPDTRLALFEMLTRVRRRWPPQLLRSAIGDDDERIQALAVEKMREQDDSACVAIMGLWLAEQFAGRPPSTRLFELALAALSESKLDERIGWLAGVLDRLAASPRAVARGRPQRVAEVLRSQRSDPRARAALHRWRVAPSRLAGWLLSPFSRARRSTPS